MKLKSKDNRNTELERSTQNDPVRVSFDLGPEDAKALREVQASYGHLDPSLSQVAKMLLKAGLAEWQRGRSAQGTATRV